MSRPTRRTLGLVAAGLAALVAAAAVPHARAAARPCAPAASAAYSARVAAVLRSGRDVWGEQLLRARGGPTLAGARRYLAPLFLARAAKAPLTATGAHYLAFGLPAGPRGTVAPVLHVADGSEIRARRADGEHLQVGAGRERYGSCLARLTGPRLAGGWLPILQTGYRDAAGRRYTQESFSTRVGGAATPTTFLELSGAATVAAGGRTLRLGAGVHHLEWRGGAPRAIDGEAYDDARAALEAYWQARLREGTVFDVPEREVMAAQRALLVQTLSLTWRYSVGNAYEELSFPEAIDVAQVAAEYGHQAVADAILRTSLTRPLAPYPDWKRGEKLLGFALHWRLFRDNAVLRSATPTLRGYVATIGAQIDGSRRGLLPRERYSSDIPDQVYGLHAQAVVWQALRELAPAWDALGEHTLARRCRALAARLGTALRSAVRASATRLAGGALFVPVDLLDGRRPFAALTASRPGSYWNLVMPYALASGLFPPGGADATGLWRYMQTHGSRLLGMVRASAFALYKTPRFPVSGTDQVYGRNVSRFLADNDRPDDLVLSLYGQLAHGMTPGTFVAGEAASVAPLPGAVRRSMYLPPNGAANGSFLETLRLTLLQETRDAAGIAARSPARVRDAARLARAGPPHRGRRRADELRPGLVHARVARRRRPRDGGAAGANAAAGARAAAPSPCGGAHPDGDAGRAAVLTLQSADRDDRPVRVEGPDHTRDHACDSLKARPSSSRSPPRRSPSRRPRFRLRPG